jgi:hypothetical protein
MTKAGVGPLQPTKHSSKMSLLKIQNLEHKYKTSKTQLPKKVDGAQSSIEKRFIPPKDISN